MTTPSTYYHATLTIAPGNSLGGLARRSAGGWLFLPEGDGPVYPVQPSEHLMLRGELVSSMAPIAASEFLQRTRGVLSR